MASDNEGSTHSPAIWKRAGLIIGAVVLFAIAWFVGTSFMLGFVSGAGGDRSTAILATIAAGVLIAPFTHVAFSRLWDYARSKV